MTLFTADPPSYADWKAPAADGETLIWPAPADLVQQTRANHDRLLRADDSIRIQNVPLARWRSEARRLIDAADDPHRLLFATGHQTELYHAGVWVKDVLIDAAAAATGGIAHHFAVDTDSPKHLNVRWPGESFPITDDAAFSTAAWSGLLRSPDAAHVAAIETSFEKSWPPIAGAAMLPGFLRSLNDPSLSIAITQAQQQLDRSLGLQHHASVTSPMFDSIAFLAFVHHALARPDEFANAYNGALETYRERTGTKTVMRPMPNLFAGEQAIEMPFWLDDLAAGTRSRPSVFRCQDCWILELLSGERFCFRAAADGFSAAEELRAFLSKSNHRIAPRALTLTMFLRMIVVDQFVHGIGGARYDQVTDAIIERHFKLPPPKFSVTTATMYFPTSVNRERACVPCLARDGHRLRHAALGPRKRELVAQIESLPRRSNERASLFLEMQRERRAAARSSETVRRWEAEYRDAEQRALEEAVVFDRELFFGVQSRARLQSMIARYREAFAHR